MKEHPFVHLPASLHSVPFLSGLKEETFEALFRDSTLLEFEPGETVLSEGEVGDEFYVLLSGSLDVIKDGALVGKVGNRGETVGELVLVNREPRAATVVAAERTFCLRAKRATLDQLEGEEKFAYEAALYRMLTVVLIERLRATNERVAELERQRAGGTSPRP